MKKYFAKSIILFTLIITFSSCQKEKIGFSISANIQGLHENAKVVLSETVSQKILDSAFVKSNNFSFTGYLENSPVELSIVVLPTKNGEQAKFTTIFMGNENIEITGEAKDFSSTLIVKGSEYNKLKEALEKKSKIANDKYDESFEKMMSIRQSGNWNDSLQDAYWGKDGIFDKIDSQLLQIRKDFVEENLNTHFGLRQLYRMRDVVNKEYLSDQYEKVNLDLKGTEYAKAIKVFLNSQPLQENDMFQDFQAENQNGKIVQFSDYFDDSRYILLEFYSPHCPWCKKALPEIKELAKSKEGQLKIITFYVDKDKEDWKRTNEQNNVPWESLWDKDGRYSETYTKYRIQGTPTYYLFDRDGRIVTKLTGFNQKTITNISNRIK